MDVTNRILVILISCFIFFMRCGPIYGSDRPEAEHHHIVFKNICNFDEGKRNTQINLEFHYNYVFNHGHNVSDRRCMDRKFKVLWADNADKISKYPISFQDFIEFTRTHNYGCLLIKASCFYKRNNGEIIYYMKGIYSFKYLGDMDTDKCN